MSGTGPVMRTVRNAAAAAVGLAAGARAQFVVDGEICDGTTHDLPEQAVFYANHSSHLDFLTLWATLPPRLRNRVRPVAAADYWSTGLKRVVAVDFFNAYLVDRKGASTRTTSTPETPGVARRGTGSQIDGMKQVLAAGDSLIIFPEGTRGTGEQLARFQAGLYLLARDHPQVAVIPVYLENLGRILPKGEILPVPHLATITFHPPIRVEAGEGREEFLARAAAVLRRGHKKEET